ncbi:MAG: GyrI-like domain-containing protein [Candidatus Oleimicrobiaceae bacterium]
MVDVPPMNFLMVSGSGDPNSSREYQEAAEVLFALSYAFKFRAKRSTGTDYAVMPLEELWWTDDPSQFSMSNKGLWKWVAMIMQPGYLVAETVAETLDEVRKKRAGAALARVRFESYHEGLSTQIMHIGSFAAEEATIARLPGFITESCYQLSGPHHEIYLRDPRRTSPEKLRTVLRQPVRR